MIGRRLPDGQYPEKPGDYSRVGDVWWLKVPNYSGVASHPGSHLGAGHTVTEHEDGTITVSPSILLHPIKRAEKPEIPGWHGYLERGVWRSC